MVIKLKETTEQITFHFYFIFEVIRSNKFTQKFTPVIILSITF